MFLLHPSLTKITLRWVLVIPFVLQTIGAVGLVGYLSYQNGEQAVENLANQLIHEVSHHISDRLDIYLQTQQQAMAINAQAVQQKSINPQDFQQLRNYLWQQITLSPLLGSSVFVNAQGEQIGYGRLQSQEIVEQAKKLTQENLSIGTVFLSELQKSHLGKRKHYLVDSKGQAKKLVYTLEVDNRQLPWYLYAKIAKKQTWSPIFLHKVTPSLGIMALAPIYDGKEFQGVFFSDVMLSEISTFLDNLQFSSSGKAFILERSGDLVATSTLEVPYLSPGKGQLQRLPAVQSQDVQTRSLAQQILKKYGSFRHIEKDTQLSLEIDQKRHFVQISPYSDRYGLDWLVVTAVPASDFMQEIETNKSQTLLLCCLTLFITIGIGIFTANRITKPIVRLSQASQALAQGEWQQPLSEKIAIAELQLLTQSFNQTAQDLKQAFERAKVALNESEDKFAKIFRNSPDFIHIISFETGCYVEVNDRFLEITGYSRAEVVGHTPLELGIAVKPEKLSQMCQLLQTEQRVYNFELELQTKSGEIKIGLISSEWIELEGKPYILSVFKDYTERIEAETALKRSEAALREAQRVAHIGSWEFDVATKTIIWSEELYHIHQLDPHQLPPSTAEILARIVHPDYYGAYQSFYEQLYRGEVAEQDFQIVLPDGSLRYVAAKGEPIFNQQGELVRLVGTVLDISDRKQVELELKQVRDLREAIFNESTDAIFLVKPPPTRLILDCNQRAVELFEVESKAQLIGIQGNILQKRQFTDEELAEIAIEIEQQGFWSREVEYLTNKGNSFWGNLAVKMIQVAGQSMYLVRVTDITDNKRIAAELQQSEARLQNLADASPVVIYTVALDKSGRGPVRYEYLSPAFEEIYEIPVAEALQDAEIIFNEIHPEDRLGYQQAIAHSMEALELFKSEWRIITPSGKMKWIQANSRPERRANGEIIWHGVAQDISDRKQLELALQASQAKLNDILNSVSAIITSMRVFPDRSWDITHVSAGCEVISGYTPEELTTNNNLWTSQIFPEDWQMMEDAVFANICAEQTGTYEYRLHHKDGSICWISQTSSSRWDEAQNCWIVTAVSSDISERKQVEAALRESEERFRRAFDDAAIGMALISIDGQFLQVNRSLCEMVGYSEAELLNLNSLDITHLDDIQTNLAAATQVLKEKQRIYQLKQRYIHKNKSIIWILISVSLVKDQNRKPLYFVAQIQDISEQQAAQRERQQIDQMKDEFISVVSHELRTPLTAIHGALGMLGTGIFEKRPERAKEMLTIALNNCDRLVRLVNDILDLERLDSGKTQLIMETCQINTLMQQAVETVQVIATQAAINLEFTPLFVTITAAPDAIVQTLINLLSNAIKFSPVNSTVWLTAELVTEELNLKQTKFSMTGPYVLFSVKDQGRGIPSEKLETIFGRFQQVDVSDSRQKGGTGLGLAICKSIVQQHGGQIWVESILGQGSTFYFTLPLNQRKLSKQN
ncbi:PAS domain S-box protein [Nostoc linckia FACHB-104]|nr:PAS domain S-box protein [Nostoc linckia FACHB-104]